MAIRSDRLVVSLISNQGHYTFLYRFAKHNRDGGGKEQTNITDLGQLQRQEREVCVSFCAFCVLTRELERNSHKSHTDFCWLYFSFSWLFSQADWSLLPSFVNSALSILSGTFLPPLLPVSPSGPWCVSRQNRQRDSLTGANINGNECYLLSHKLSRYILTFCLPILLNSSPHHLKKHTTWYTVSLKFSKPLAST